MKIEKEGLETVTYTGHIGYMRKGTEKPHVGS